MTSREELATRLDRHAHWIEGPDPDEAQKMIADDLREAAQLICSADSGARVDAEDAKLVATWIIADHIPRPFTPPDCVDDAAARILAALEPASTESSQEARVEAAIAKAIPAAYKMLRECSHVHGDTKADLADALAELFDATTSPGLTDSGDEGADRSGGGASEPPQPEPAPAVREDDEARVDAEPEWVRIRGVILKSEVGTPAALEPAPPTLKGEDE